MQIIYCKATDIYNAAVAGAKRGYNRSTDDYTAYEKELNETYRNFLAEIDDDDMREQVIKHTHGSWRNAMLPLAFVMFHHHKQMVKCETHVRVRLADSYAVFDIPMTHWQRLCAKSEMLLRKAAA